MVSPRPYQVGHGLGAKGSGRLGSARVGPGKLLRSKTRRAAIRAGFLGALAWTAAGARLEAICALSAA